MNNKVYKNDMEIDVVDLFFSIMLRWRVLCICVVIGMLMGGAIGGFRIYKNVNTSVASLTEKDESRYKQYTLYLYSQYKNIEELNAYMERSALMRLDANDVCRKELVYVISSEGGDLELEQTNDYIVSVLEQIVNSNKAFNDILKAVGESGEYTLNDVIELLSVERVSGSGLTGLETISEPGVNLIASEGLVITVFGPDKDYCEAAGSVLTDAIDEKKAELLKEGRNARIEQISDNLFSAASETIRTQQGKLIASCKTSSEAIAYYKKNVMDSDKIVRCDSMAREMCQGKTWEQVKQTIVIDKKETTFKDYVSLKWILAGAFGAFILAAGIAGLKYFGSGKVKTAHEFQMLYGITVLGEYYKKTVAGNSIDRFLYSRKYRIQSDRSWMDKWLDTLAARVVIVSKNKKLNNICLVTTSVKEEQIKEFSEVLQRKTGQDLEVSVAPDVLGSAADMHRADQADGIMFVENLADTHYSDMNNVVRFIEEQNKIVLGAAIYDEQ